MCALALATLLASLLLPRSREAPGHTPGHQSIRIDDDLILGGDVACFASGLDDHRFPVYGEDYVQQARSAERLRRLRDQGARVIPGHDPDILRPGPVLT